MTPYYTLYIAYWAASLATIRGRAPVSWTNFFLFAVPLIVFVGTRRHFTDEIGYAKYFYHITDFSRLSFPNYLLENGSSVEAGFSLLVLVSKWVGIDFYGFIFLFAAISILVKLYAFRIISPAFGLSVVIYIAAMMYKDMGQIRSAMAASFIALSVVMAARRNLPGFILAWCAAFSFHFAALVALPIYFLHAIFGTRPRMIALIALAFLVAGLGKFAHNFIEILQNTLDLDTSYRIVRYMSLKYAKSYSFLGGTMSLYLLIGAVLIYFYENFKNINAYLQHAVVTYVYGFAVFVAVSDYGIIGGRVLDTIVNPMMAVALPAIVFLFPKERRPALVVFYGVFFLLFFRFLSRPNEYQTSLTGVFF